MSENDTLHALSKLEYKLGARTASITLLDRDHVVIESRNSDRPGAGGRIIMTKESFALLFRCILHAYQVKGYPNPDPIFEDLNKAGDVEPYFTTYGTPS